MYIGLVHRYCWQVFSARRASAFVWCRCTYPLPSVDNRYIQPYTDDASPRSLRISCRQASQCRLYVVPQHVKNPPLTVRMIVSALFSPPCLVVSHIIQRKYWLPTRKNYFTRWLITLLVVWWTGKGEQKRKVRMDAAAESERDPVSKHQIQPECGE